VAGRLIAFATALEVPFELFAAFLVEPAPVGHVGFGPLVDFGADVPAQVEPFQFGEDKILWYAKVV
jgi:hypothetical protein